MQRHQLLNWIDSGRRMAGTFEEMLLRARIDHFFHSNKQDIDAAITGREALYKKYLTLDEHGNPVMEEVEGKIRPVMKNPLERREYEEKFMSFMMQMLSIEVV